MTTGIIPCSMRKHSTAMAFSCIGPEACSVLQCRRSNCLGTIRMIPWTTLGTAVLPGNSATLKLARRGDEFSIRFTGIQGELMNSRVHGSEDALATLGCAHLRQQADAVVLVGGLGMGFTQAAALSVLSETATVMVAELIPEVIQWNRDELGACAGRPLDDPRTVVHTGDVGALIRQSPNRFDAILLDVDNGPEAITDEGNDWLYGIEGLASCQQALRSGGVLAVWSATPDPRFEKRLRKVGYRVNRQTVRARAGKGSRHSIFLART